MRKLVNYILPVILFFDIYNFSGIYTLSKYFLPPIGQYAAYSAYIIYNISLIGVLGYGLKKLSVKSSRRPSSGLMTTAALLVLPKILFGIVLLLEDAGRLAYGAIFYIGTLIYNIEYHFPARNPYVALIAVVVYLIIFLVVLFGITRGKHHYKVKRLTLKFPDLPTAFDNIKIVQISDVHSGSFVSRKGVEKGISLINKQDPHIIVFTGDLVNHSSHEFEPWLDIFATLRARIGKCSILGNHDYGDYISWPTPEHKRTNMRSLLAMHKDMGFRLLLDENVKIERGGASIFMLGVENWGLPPFPRRGKLRKALLNVPADAFKVLLSHDPTHWDAEVLKQPEPIHLTLSGHTHGMQFGFDIFGIKWSPVKYRYRRWLGLYQEGIKYLYVNRGFGFLGFPGRIGMWPEITVFTLRGK